MVVSFMKELSSIPLDFNRKLTFRKDGKTFEGKLRIHSLEKCDDLKWICFWSLDYVCTEGKARGDDSLNALTNALYVIHKLIVGTSEDGMEIWWQYEGDMGEILSFITL